MATAEYKQGNQDGGRFLTKEGRGTLLEATGVVVTAVGLAAASLLAIGTGVVVFEVGRRSKNTKKK